MPHRVGNATPADHALASARAEPRLYLRKSQQNGKREAAFPEEGSNMKAIRSALTAAALLAAGAFHPATQAAAQPAPSPPPSAAMTGPCEVRGENWRGRPFFEVLFMNRVPGGPAGIGNYFNSLGNRFEISDEMVDARFRALNAAALRQEFGSDGVFFNGPRRFVANGFTGISYNDCRLRVMNTIPFYLYGTFEVPNLEAFISGAPPAYHVLVSRRTNTFTFNAGEQVHELITPEGEVYTMFSLSLKVDPNNTIANLGTLGQRLTLPAGWRYRMRRLDQPLVLSSRYDANPPNTIVLDQFEGNYQHNPGQR